jgi:hypothetical protein
MKIADRRKAKLERIQLATNDAIKRAYKGGVDDAVNWADLQCIDVERCENIEGDVIYRVIIEEASPDANDFRAFVYDYLNRHFDGMRFSVLTEW